MDQLTGHFQNATHVFDPLECGDLSPLFFPLTCRRMLKGDESPEDKSGDKSPRSKAAVSSHRKDLHGDEERGSLICRWQLRGRAGGEFLRRRGRETGYGNYGSVDCGRASQSPHVDCGILAALELRPSEGRIRNPNWWAEFGDQWYNPDKSGAHRWK